MSNRPLVLALAAALLATSAILTVAPTASACTAQIWYVEVTTSYGGVSASNCHLPQTHEGGATSVEVDTFLA
ncbi:MAG TPA: hypothetical protein VNZ52_14450 [Candidatus Thermoplasmatota archaeon]|nr:hypothetical protein [Candidatus Thermoplasmatota archaeon]